MGAGASVPGNVRSDGAELALKAVDGGQQLGDAIAADATISAGVAAVGEAASGALAAAGTSAVGEAAGCVSEAVVELANSVPVPQVDADGVLDGDEVWSAGQR